MVDPLVPPSNVDQPRGHEFDGIVEYDNALPKWFQALFVLSVVWVPFYIAYYHFAGPKLGAERLQIELTAITEERAKQGLGTLGEADLRTLSHDAKRIATGKDLYLKTGCSACHGPEATGLVGPNLRDKYWIYGSDMTQILDVIAKGRPEKSMPKQPLSEDEALNLSIYIADLGRQGEQNGPRPLDPKRELEAPITY